MAEPMGTSRPRCWPRRLLIGANIFVALCLVATGSTYAYLKWQFGKVDKIGFACDVLRNCGDDDPGEAMNVLLVGSDSRSEITAEEQAQFGTTAEVGGGQRSDTIIVLHVDPRDEKAALLSIPRDLLVPIAGSTNRTPKLINSAFQKGPETLIATIRQELGIEIDHYAQVDFNGFRGVVNALGGVRLYFPSAARDSKSGLNVAEAGCVALDGDKALAYVRSRNYQSLERGRWQTDPTADIGRIERQQDFIRVVIRKASRSGRNPLTLNSLISTAVENVKIDKAFSTKDIRRLAGRFRSLEPDAVEILSLPTVPTGAHLRLKQPDAGTVVDRFNGRAAPAPEAGAPAPPRIVPGTVRVLVLNGTGVAGQAGMTAQGLRQASFGVAGTGEADSFGYAASVIRFGKGQLDKATLLQAYVDGGATLKEDLTLRGGDLVLVTGRSFKAVLAPRDQAAPATTATTAAPSATTAPPATAPAPAAAPDRSC
ncbi:MAG: LCP family protein [Acidimicrobiales bacterium]